MQVKQSKGQVSSSPCLIHSSFSTTEPLRLSTPLFSPLLSSLRLGLRLGLGQGQGQGLGQDWLAEGIESSVRDL